MKKCYMAMTYMAMGAGAALLIKRYYKNITKLMDKEADCIKDLAEEKLDELKGK